MDINKVIKVLNSAKSKNGLTRKEIAMICGKDTDAIVWYLHAENVCIWATNGSIIKLKKERAALLMDELEQKKKSKISSAIKWIMETFIAPLIKS